MKSVITRVQRALLAVFGRPTIIFLHLCSPVSLQLQQILELRLFLHDVFDDESSTREVLGIHTGGRRRVHVDTDRRNLCGNTLRCTIESIVATESCNHRDTQSESTVAGLSNTNNERSQLLTGRICILVCPASPTGI